MRSNSAAAVGTTGIDDRLGDPGRVEWGKGLRAPQGGVLGRRHIRNFLTNRHLIGEVKTRDDKAEAVRRSAQWSPRVDVDLFRKVQKEVERREGDPHNKKRTSKGTFVLRPVCAHCGIEYHGGRNRKDQGNERTYVHPTPNKPCIRRSTRPTSSTAVAHGRWPLTSSRPRSRT
ncbi:MAG TPA: recombinase family protein [Longimicrobiaceae bacterium]|nr:recombinase family protein [Longimicrobiaceae bacterium]